MTFDKVNITISRHGKSNFKQSQIIRYPRINAGSSDALELKFGEPSRAELEIWRAEPSWTTLKSELNTSWIFFETDKY